MDQDLMDVAADNLEDAQRLTGPSQMQRMALGLEQMARALRVGARNGLLMGTAADNFEDAQKLTGPAQMQRLCLGLMQIARAM